MSEFDLSKQTVEQYEGDCGCDPEVGCVPCELCHDLAVIGRLRSENERLREALIEIRDSSYCQYENTESVRRGTTVVPGQYGIGVTDGHRFCSAIAQKAMNFKQ